MPEEQAAFMDNVFRPAWPARPGRPFRETAAAYREQAEMVARQLDFMDQRGMNELPPMLRRHHALSLRALQNEMLAGGHCLLAQVYGQHAAELERTL